MFNVFDESMTHTLSQTPKPRSNISYSLNVDSTISNNIHQAILRVIYGNWDFGVTNI